MTDESDGSAAVPWGAWRTWGVPAWGLIVALLLATDVGLRIVQAREAKIDRELARIYPADQDILEELKGLRGDVRDLKAKLDEVETNTGETKAAVCQLERKVGGGGLGLGPC